MTAESAAITSIKQIPQCSCASASYDLSDNQIYPYFFRTVGSAVLYAESLVNWVGSMGWNNFALIYTNDEVGQQGDLHTIILLLFFSCINIYNNSVAYGIRSN